MKKQPVLHVGIMAETKIDFALETGYHHGGTLLTQGDYSIEIKGKNMILQGEDILVISDEKIILLPNFRTNAFLLKNVTIGINFHWEQKEDQRFTGGVLFVPEDGKIRVINTVYLEDYLKSVISSEMSATSSPDLLKAHAVISRSWLLAQVDKSRKITQSGEKYETAQISSGEIIRWYDREDHTGFDVCADDHCQRYQGITKIISAQALDAVEVTAGQVLMYGEEICDARFSKCCGGISEQFDNVWEPLFKPYLTPVSDTAPLGRMPSADLTNEKVAEAWIKGTPDAFCHTSDKKVLSQVLPGFDQKTTDFYRWKVVYTQAEISRLINARSGIDFGSILRLEPLLRGPSGRILKLRIVGTKNSIIVGKELEIRKWLSSTHLYSSAFIIELGAPENGVPVSVTLLGAGWGHGVGLCQIGAAVMGERGYSYREILQHYFRHSTIETIYQD